MADRARKDGSTVLDTGSREATTVIETPWDVWQSIARGEIRGMQHWQKECIA